MKSIYNKKSDKTLREEKQDEVFKIQTEYGNRGNSWLTSFEDEKENITSRYKTKIDFQSKLMASNKNLYKKDKDKYKWALSHVDKAASRIVKLKSQRDLDISLAKGNYLSKITSNQEKMNIKIDYQDSIYCLLYTSPSPRDATLSRMPSSA